MDIAIQDLGLKQLYVIYPGTLSYRLGEQIQVTPLNSNLSAQIT